MMFGTTWFSARRRRHAIRRRPPVALASLLAALAVLAWAPLAQAISVAAPIRSASADHDEEFRISRADCESTNGFTFTITDILSGDDLSVWGTGTGADCSTNNARTVDNTCTLIESLGVVSNTSAEQTIRHSAIAAVLSDVNGCTDGSSSDAPRTVTLYFLVNESQGDVPASDYTMVDTLEVDLIGPPAPGNVSVSVNDDTSLLVTFSEPAGTTDIKGYRAYCDPMPSGGTTSSGGGAVADYWMPAAGAGGMAGAAGAGGATSSGTAGAGGSTSGGGGAGGAGGGSGGAGGSTSSGTGGATSSGTGGSGGAGDAACSSAVLTPGELPPSAYECGSVTGTGDITVTGLVQGVEYVIAVAAYDQVHNQGVLSELGCGTAEPVSDFFDRYRQAGGQAGGGFCQCELVGISLDRPLAVVAALLLGLAFGLRRSRRTGGLL